MKLEVGIFIRTPLGIDKIICLRIQDEYGCNYDTQLEHNLFINNEREHISIDGECFEKEEIKTSHNIIDLIEVGDYVNGCKVIKNTLKDGGNIVIVQGGNCFTNEDIKTVVTKEQFKAIEYKVESDE